MCIYEFQKSAVMAGRTTPAGVANDGESYIDFKSEWNSSESLSVYSEEHIRNREMTPVSQDFQNETVPIIPPSIAYPGEQFAMQESPSLVWNIL
jgi:hypothetical protein